MKNQKIDHRVRYTKMVIKKSLLELMKEKSINNITVTEICKLADINRNTFYCHYENQFELLESLEDELYKDIVQIVERDLKNNQTATLTCALCKYIKDNQRICKIILSDKGDQKLLERIMYISYDYTKNAADIDDELFDNWYAFVAHGTISVIKRWINNGLKESPDTVAAFIEKATSSVSKEISCEQ